jgi:CheY-like chemotaxis protein
MSPEELMEPRTPKVLLIGENPQGSSYLAKRLQERGCECEFAVSYQEACSLLGAQGFDLVLSPMRLRSSSLFPLIGLLDGSGITLFYSHAVEDGCWWLPALRHGQKCFGSSALRPSEFVAALDEAIEEICFRAAMERNSQQSVTPRQPGSLATLPSSREELPPAGPKLPKSGATAEAVTASKVQQGIERA